MKFFLIIFSNSEISVNLFNAVVRPTCQIKLFEIILKLFQCFISHVMQFTTSETEIKLFQPLKEF